MCLLWRRWAKGNDNWPCNTKSKGGEDSFENCVTACRPCNAEKDDLTIEEWGREL